MHLTYKLSEVEMGDEYELIPFTFRGQILFYELVRNGRSKIQKMLNSPKSHEEVINLFNQISKIREYGVKTSCGTNKLRLLDASINLYEIKGYAGVNREMAVIVANATDVVLLFEFKGHQGSGNIQNEIDKAKALAEIAHDLLKSVLKGGKYESY